MVNATITPRLPTIKTMHSRFKTSRTMATPTSEEIQEIWEEETEYTTPQEQFEDDYPEIVEIGNETDDDE